MPVIAHRLVLAAGLVAAAASASLAAPEKYVLDPSHSQVVFSYNHLGFSTTWSMFAGINGEIMFDKDAPQDSSVSVSFPLKTMYTGWQKRFEHFMSPDFFNASDDSMVSFTSTGIEVTGDTTGKITGDLTINGVTVPVVLDAKLNQQANHPMLDKPWVGFSATTMVKRSDFNVDAFAPYVSDEVQVMISVEAGKAE